MASGFSAVRTPHEVLRCVKLVVADEAVLMGTDNQQGATVRVLGVKDSEPGVALLEPELGPILESSSDAEMVIEAAEDKVSIRGANSEFELPCQNPDFFPELPAFDNGGYRVCSSADFRRLIDLTSHACLGDGEVYRAYTLNGCILEFHGDKVMMGASDGSQVARCRVPFGEEGDVSSFNPRPLVPAKALKLIGKHISDEDPPVHFRAGAQEFMVRTEMATISSLLLEGRFPPLEVAFPDPFVDSARIKASLLRDAVQQASILTSVESEAPDFRFAPGVLSLASHGNGKGKSTIRIPIDYDGKEVVVAMRPKHLAGALKRLDDDAEVSACLEGIGNGVAFRTQDNYTFMVGLITRRDAKS